MLWLVLACALANACIPGGPGYGGSGKGKEHEEVEKVNKMKGSKGLPLIDVHCHLEDLETKLSQAEPVHDLPSLIGEIEKRMKLVFTSGIDIAGNRRNLEISRLSDKILPCLGLSPVSVGKNPDLFPRFISEVLPHQEEIAGIGEVGLDYYWEKDESHRKTQRDLFPRFIELANELGKPLIIHTRSAMGDTLKVLERETPDRFFIHSFRGSLSQARRVIDLGGFISISTACVRFPSDYTKLINNIDIEYMLTETDSPYLSPVKGSINYPWNVSLTLDFMAKRKGMPVEDIAGQISKNVERIFG